MMTDQKKRFTITLTEPVVFLRSQDPSGRHPPHPNDSPTLVRGILTLNVAKPIGISSIEVELTGELAITYQEDLVERRKTYSSAATIFRADQVTRGSNPSVRPGFSPTHFNGDEHAATALSRAPSLPRGRSERRSVASVPPDLGPTPPYTAADPPSPFQPRLFVTREDSAQTLEELRQTLRDNLEGQTHHSDFTPPPSRPHIAFSFPSPAMHSNIPTLTLNTSNDLFPGEDANHNDDLMHTSPSFEGDPSVHDTVDDPTHIWPHGFHTPNHPSRVHSPEHTHQAEPRTHGNNHDHVNTPAGHSRLRLSVTSVLDAVRDITSRTPSRSRSVARLDEREHGRPRVRIEESEVDMGEQVGGPEDGSEPESNVSHLSDRGEHREHHLLGLGRILGLERDHDKVRDGEHKSRDHGENWREFKAGTYSYPLSFLLPPDLPPTFSLPYGSLGYTIKAVAHRPGTFTSKLSCQVPLLVVAAPAVGDGEVGIAGDPGPIIVQRQWREKLAYSFGLTSRMFLLGSESRLNAAEHGRVRFSTESLVEIGAEARSEALYGTAVLDLTLLPVEKLKIWKLVIFVDQRVRYIDKRELLYRDDDKWQMKVLEVQDTCTVEEKDLMREEDHNHKDKHKRNHDVVPIPLLPTPMSPDRSPLLRYLPSSTDPSTLAGPGPYSFSTTIALPGCDGREGGSSRLLGFTVRQKSSGMRVEHSLRTVIRVESVGEGDTSAPKLVDIAIQTPITILSCRCVPEYQTLPEYSQITEGSFQDSVACPCHMRNAGHTEQANRHLVGNPSGLTMTPSSTSSFESDSVPTDEQHAGQVHECSVSTSHARNDQATPLTTSLPPPSPSQGSWIREPVWSRSSYHADTPSHTQHHPHSHSRSQSYSVWTSHVRTHSQEPPFLTPHTSRPPSPLARYERLVSGLESEAGEAPPSYESLTSGHRCCPGR